MKKYLIFDTETCGLIADFKTPLSRATLDAFPHIIQLAYILYDEDGKILKQRCDLVKPDGWTMPTGDFWVDHGYTQEKSEEFGVPLIDLLLEIKEAINEADYMIAHNIAFDEKILGAEFIRNSLTTGKIINKLCTKEIGTGFCKIRNSWGKFKWPTLTELHIKLFNCEFDGAHDALADVKACGKCFFELKKIGVIDE